MTKQTEALKMAIEAMECAEKVDWELNSLHVLNILQAIHACKEALEQPAQEPVAYFTCEINAGTVEWNQTDKEYKHAIPLYTHPAPSWQGLSDDEIFELHHKWIINSGNKDTQYDFARAIEQALKEKNT